MSSLKGSVIANFLGQGWASFAQLLFIPIYLHVLGIEAYALVGFYAMMLAGLQVFDLGISQTINRELARSVGEAKPAQEIRSLVRALEVVYWMIGLTAGVAVAVASPWIASGWLNAEKVDESVVQSSVAIMGAVLALQWPVGLYSGGLMGLHKQVRLNVARIGLVTLSLGGAAIVITTVRPTVTTFFLWQVFASAVGVFVMRGLLWRHLPRCKEQTRFSLAPLKQVWRFAAGMSGVSVASFALTQIDKWILSKLVSLELFGFYMLATSVSNALHILISPIYSAVYPRLSALVAARDQMALRQLYHKATQVMAVAVVPVALVVSFFGDEILLLWTGDPRAASIAGPIVSLLILGTAINGLMHVPYGLQLAYGWTSLAIGISVSFSILTVPAVVVAAIHFGPVGVASIWVLLNVMYVVIGVPLTHRKLLHGESVQWFARDVMPVVLAAVAIGGIGRAVVPPQLDTSTSIGSLVLLALLMTAGGGLVAPLVRRQFLRR